MKIKKTEVSTPFYILSPNGFTLDGEEKLYTSLEEAREDAKKWVKRYEAQTYYRVSLIETIPYEEILNHLTISNEIYGFEDISNPYLFDRPE